jgi:hypothetical protein
MCVSGNVAHTRSVNPRIAAVLTSWPAELGVDTAAAFTQAGVHGL